MNGISAPIGAINKATVGALLLAVARLPYSYYIFLRWSVTLSACIHLWCAIKGKRWGATAIFGVIGILFNPFEPIYLTKGVWVVIDVFAAIFMIVGFEELRKPKAEAES